MRKHYSSLLSLAALLCAMLCITSCKKDDNEIPDPENADFFIQANYLAKDKTDGDLAPRLVVNYNDELVMVELWQIDDAPLETILLLAPDHQAMLLSGDEKQLAYIAYDLQTDTPSDEVLLVAPLDDNNLLLTLGTMDWNTNTLTKGDMMVLPIDGSSKNRGDDLDSENREFFFNHLIKVISENFDKVTDYIPGTFGSALSAFGNFISVGMTVNLYNDKPLELLDHSEYFVTNTVDGKVKSGILEYVPTSLSEATEALLKAYNWFKDDGNGKVNDYPGEAEGGVTPYIRSLTRSTTVCNDSQPGVPPVLYHLNLQVTNITETSAFFKGNFRFGGSSILPSQMGYVFKISGGPEHTEEDMEFHGKNITGLQKATKYTAYAYAIGNGQRVVSPSVTFWTLGFEAFPDELNFPRQGDTKYVGFSYSHDDIGGWEVTSCPQWCTYTIDDLGLLAVTAGETEDERSGIITVKANSYALGTVTQNIAVTQEGKGFFTGTPFENTNWNIVHLAGQSVENGVRRVSEWHYNSNGGYYTYHNESYSETETEENNLMPIFTHKKLYLAKTDEGEIYFSFVKDTIYCTIVYEDQSSTMPFINGIENEDQKATIYRYFDGDNVFCIKAKSEQIYDHISGSSYSHKYKFSSETIYKFKINAGNRCAVEYTSSVSYETLNHGSEYTGPLQYTINTTLSGSGTYGPYVEGEKLGRSGVIKRGAINLEDFISLFGFTDFQGLMNSGK